MSTYDIDELRQTMAEKAEDAPDTLGVLAGAHESARRYRRKRRVIRAAGVTAALAAVAVATPTALDALDRGSGGTSAAERPAPGPMGVQLTLRPNDHAYSMLAAAGTTAQHMEIRPRVESDGDKFSGTVRLHGPGTFDDSKVRGGERVTVNGKPAFYVADGDTVFPPPVTDLPASTTPAEPRKGDPLIAWEEAPGQWITVSGSPVQTAADLVALADLVEVTTPELPRSPFYLGYLPAGLVPQGALTHDRTRVSLAFGTASNPLQGDWGKEGYPDFDEPLLVDSTPVPPGTADQARARLAEGGAGAPTKLGEYDSWYYDQGDPEGKARNGATLTVMTPQCEVRFSVEDKNRVPRAELEKIALATQFKDCNTPTTWVRPVP